MYTKKEMENFLKKRVTNTFLLLYYIYNIYTYLNIIYTPFFIWLSISCEDLRKFSFV